MIKGKLYYRIGNQKQWIPAKYVGEHTENMEERISGIVYLPLINHDKNLMVALLDQNGNFTGKYLKTNTNWKVFAKKILNGKLYYRLGTQNQWVPAKYAKFYK